MAALRAIYNAKPRVLASIEHRFGTRTLSTLTSANRPFHVLEHVETLWLKHFATYLCQHADIASLIWLHDGVWVSPLPPSTCLLAANRAACSHLGLEAPLALKTTELAQVAQSAQAELLAGRPPPSGDPPPLLHAPRPSVMPVLPTYDGSCLSVWLALSRCRRYYYPRPVTQAAHSLVEGGKKN